MDTYVCTHISICTYEHMVGSLHLLSLSPRFIVGGQSCCELLAPTANNAFGVDCKMGLSGSGAVGVLGLLG